MERPIKLLAFPLCNGFMRFWSSLLRRSQRALNARTLKFTNSFNIEGPFYLLILGMSWGLKEYV